MQENKKIPQKPQIRKLGTVSCNNIVETTPLVFRGELYRFEVVRRKSFASERAASVAHWSELSDDPCLRFLHVRTNTATPTFAKGHTFGFPWTENGVMYVVTGGSREGGSDSLIFLRSDDLVHWEQYTTLEMPGWRIYNMNIAKMGDTYTLLIEIDAPAEECGRPYTFRFLQSKDLIHWEYSPVNPVLMYDDEDRKIASPFLTPADRERIANAWNVNNSDMELCEYLGRTIIYYSWGDQRGTEFLAEASSELPMHDFLRAFFEV